ncbi:hypothetical protein ACJRO7_004097, partial [Eucalyptus globulus]
METRQGSLADVRSAGHGSRKHDSSNGCQHQIVGRHSTRRKAVASPDFGLRRFAVGSGGRADMCGNSSDHRRRVSWAERLQMQ